MTVHVGKLWLFGQIHKDLYINTLFRFYQEQSKLLWKVRDDLQKNCSLPELREMLEDNELSSQGGESSVSS